MRAHIVWKTFRSCVVPARFSSLITADDASPKPFDAMPGPKPLPFIGNSWELKNNLKRLNHYFRDGFEKYGNVYRLRGMGNYSVLVKDPSTIENILRAEGKYPERDNTFMKNFCWLFENRLQKPLSLTFLSGKEWKEVRSAVGKQIIPRNVQIYHHGFNDIINKFTHFVRSNRNPDGFIQDLADPIKRLLMDLSAFIVFGTNWDVVANPSDEDAQFSAAVNFIFEVFFRIATELPMYKLYNNKLSREFKAAFECMHRRSEAEVDRICELIDSGRESNTPGLLEQWLREGKLTKETAIDEAQNLFPAGVDTTSNQSTFLLHAIAANEEVQDRLYEEIRTVLGQDTLPLPEHLPKMPFLKGCLQESYRLHGTNGLHSRVLQEDTVLHGYHVPKDTTVTYSILTGGMDSSLFPDPLKFDPERWKRDDTHGFAVQPFGFGPRSCYGRRFAELIMKLLLVQMVSNFKISTSIKNLKTVEKTTIYPGEDVTIHLEDRKH